MADRFTSARTKCEKWLRGAALALGDATLLMGLLAAPWARAQTRPAERPAFEVASIKPHRDSGNFQILTFSNGRLTFGGPVVMLIDRIWPSFQSEQAPFRRPGLDSRTRRFLRH